jgi:hypothetical protein
MTRSIHRLFIIAIAFLGVHSTHGELPRISPDDPSSLAAGIEAAARAGVPKVTIPSGTYRPTPVNQRQYLRIAGAQNLEIDARGVTLLRADPRFGGIELYHCRNVTLRGMTLVCETPPFAQGKIEAIDPEGAFYDVRPAKGYPANWDDANYFPASMTGYVFDPKTRQWKAGTSDLSCERLERLEGGSFRMYWRGGRAAPPLQPVATGDLMAFRGHTHTDIHVAECQGVQIVDVTIQSGTGFCVHESDGPGGNRYGFKVTYGPKPLGADEPPLIACNADAFHSSSVRKGPTLEGCQFEGMCDDGIAIHGSYAMVFEAKENRLVIATPFDHNFFVADDPVRAFDGRGNLTGEAIVVAVRPAADLYAPTTRPNDTTFRDKNRFWEIELDRPLKVSPGDRISDPAACGAGYVVHRCVIRNHRARGMLLKADKGLVEDNVIDGSTMAGIVLAPEFYWNEACFSRNVKIINNTIRHVGYQNAGSWMPQPGAITIRGEGDLPRLKAAGTTQPVHTLGHSHVIVQGNRIENCDGVNLLISDAADVLVKDNRFRSPQKQRSWRGADYLDPTALVVLGPSKGVRFEGNVSDKRGESAGPLLQQMAGSENPFAEQGIEESK